MRLKALQSYQILDTLEEKDFDDLTILASTICQVPIALISLVDEKRQWFKSHTGLDARETPIEQSFCAHAIHSTADLMIVENAHNDLRFVNNPLVTGSPNITFYAGVPLTNHEGYALGTLCVISPKEKNLSDEQKQALKVIAKQVMDKLELRRKIFELEHINHSLKDAESKSKKLFENLELSHSRIRSLVQQAPVAIIVFRGKDFVIESVNPPMLALLDKQEDILHRPLLEAIPELREQAAFKLLYKVLETGKPVYGDNTPVQLKRNGKIEIGYYNFSYSPLV
ncbi:MAG: GAF domain-containing protein, partial [Pedobacter sp.]